MNLGQLFEQLDERDFSIIGPFLERLYELIDIKMPLQESIHKIDYGPHHAIAKSTYQGKYGEEPVQTIFRSKTEIYKGENATLSKYHFGCTFPEFVPVLAGFCLFTREQIFNCKLGM